MRATYSCFTLVRNHHQYLLTEPELGHEPGMNDCESDGLVTGLRIPNTPQSYVRIMIPYFSNGELGVDTA